jgi:hypothetical protein
VIVYAPVAPGATVKEPVTVKSVPTEQLGEPIAPPGDEVMSQAPEAVSKLLPVTAMRFPIPEEVGVRVIFGTTVRVAGEVG